MERNLIEKRNLTAEKNMKPVRVGIIGLGIGEKYFEALQNHSEAEVVALCDFSAEKRAKYEARFPKIRFYQEAQALISDTEVNLVCIASYDDDHYGQVLESLKAEKNVFVEKPVCQTWDEALKISDLLEKKPHLSFSSNLILRKSPRFERLKGRLIEGYFGDLFAIEGDYNYGRLHKITEGWRGSRSYYSAILGGGIHIIDLFVWLLGSDVIEEVVTYGNNIASRGSGFRFNDLAYSLLKTRSGVVLKLGVNFGCHYPHFHRFSVYGTEGSFENKLEGGYFYKGRDQECRTEKMAEPYPGTHKADLLLSFIDQMTKAKKAVIDIHEIFSGLAVCFALEKSMESGKPEPVKYFFGSNQSG